MSKTWKIDGTEWAGKTRDGEFVKAREENRTSYDIFQPVYSESTADNHDYVMPVGCWEPKEILPLNEEDELFLQGAYEADLSSCVECCVYHDTDTVYQPEFQFTEDGLVCDGCFADYLKGDEERLEGYIDKADQCIPLECAENLKKSRRLQHIERFIGGMVDGRGGRYGGEYTREGHPKELLKEFKAKHPTWQFVFSHDESGQFQTYFSIWRVLPVKAKAKKRGAR